jgi:hypothetical protein
MLFITLVATVGAEGYVLCPKEVIQGYALVVMYLP